MDYDEADRLEAEIDRLTERLRLMAQAALQVRSKDTLLYMDMLSLYEAASAGLEAKRQQLDRLRSPGA